MKRWLILLVTAGLMAGCITKVKTPQPLSQEELKVLFEPTRDPRTFWITVYQSKSGPLFSGANRLHPEQLSVLPFESLWKSSTPIIEIEHRQDKTFDALVDTSSPESWLTVKTAQKMSFIPFGPPAYEAFPKHVKDPFIGYGGIITKLVFDLVHMENALFYTRSAKGPFTPLERGEGKKVDAVMGCNLMIPFQFVQFDFPEKEFVVSSTLDYTPNSQKVLAMTPRLLTQGAYSVEGMMNGEETTFILDTGGAFEVAMHEPTRDVITQLSIGDLVCRNVSVTNAVGLGFEGVPRIGRGVLSKFKVTFDNKRKMVYFEKP